LLTVIEKVTGETFTPAERERTIQGPDEERIVNSGLEDTMISAYNEIRGVWKQYKGISLRTAAFISAIDKIAQSYLEMGIFP
jgi:glutamate dehydrogenase (NAD(P)+)